MPPKQKVETEHITIEKIFDHLKCSNVISNIEKDLFAAFQDKFSYKYLENLGLQQWTNAVDHNIKSREDIIENTISRYNIIKEVTSIVETEIEQTIQENLKSSLRNILKEEILNFINKATQPNLAVPENFVNIAKRSVTTENVTTKEDNPKFVKLNNGGLGAENIVGDDSRDSLSSVHTSDLSSFDDEISISSDEETGRERVTISLKFAQEEIDRIKANCVDEAYDQNKIIKLESEDVKQSDVPVSGSHGITPKSLPPRIRKPNSKYISKDILSPFHISEDVFNQKQKTDDSLPGKKGKPKKADNSPSQVKESNSSLPRKRGRPRKYSSEDSPNRVEETDSSITLKKGMPKKYSSEDSPSRIKETESSITPKRGSLKKYSLKVSPSRVVETDSFTSHKKGRPRKYSSENTLSRIEKTDSSIPHKKGRPSKYSSEDSPSRMVKTDGSISRKRERPKKYSEDSLSREELTDSSIPRKKGRPRKYSPENTPSRIEETDSSLLRKRGSPRKYSSEEAASRVEKTTASLPLKRGRPRKSLIEDAPNGVEGTDSPLPRKRGRPKKCSTDAPSQVEGKNSPLPRKRGRPKKNSAEETVSDEEEFIDIMN